MTDLDEDYGDRNEFEPEYSTADLSILDRGDGMPRKLAGKCTTCIFWPGNRMHLMPGRLKDMVEQAGEGHIVCHQTLPGNESGLQAAACHGHYEASYTNFHRVMERIGNGWHDVPAPAKEAKDGAQQRAA